MKVKFILPQEWRAEIEKHGTPLYIDDEDGHKYVLLEVIVEPDETGDGYRAYAETLPLYGKGKTERKAINNLAKVITQFQKSFLPKTHERRVQ